MGTTSSFLRRSARHPSGHPCPRHSPLLRAARCALSSFRLPSGASYAVIRSLLPPQPGPPPGRIMLTPSLLLGPARPPSMNPLAITPPWARAPVPAPVWVQSLPFGPILTLSLLSLRLSASLSFLA
ncbi:hypothetical protein BD311DRAFT_316445 [Dichomitus squalens]|uniref:Uncharacterized protein n=1 Tax=Dichomitus squalens TaxID=114155 RepID=A0A4Q9MP86_9APHY|nr:hypothetical protein BD311DRAFT_316445 [Dichomitus squalens]